MKPVEPPQVPANDTCPVCRQPNSVAYHMASWTCLLCLAVGHYPPGEFPTPITLADILREQK